MRLGALACALFVCISCGSPKPHGNGDAGPNGDGVIGQPDAFDGPWDDFPGAPIVDSGPTDPSGLFGDPTQGQPSGGPCLIEPEIGTLFPRNWLRPRFTWVPMGSENLFELRITAANEKNPLVVYTQSTTWTMPAAMWAGVSSHIVDQPITVSVRGGTLSGSTLTTEEHGSSGDIRVAPADAPGAIVYWTTSGGTALRGFHVGDESVKDILRPTDAGSQCVGCHSSTPDGTFVGFSSSQNPGNGDPTTLGMLSADGTHKAPAFLTPDAIALMSRVNQELPVFSAQHWTAGDHVALTMWPVNNKFEIIWTNLEATSQAQGTGWGVIGRGTDANPAAYASFAHTTDTILYVSSSTVTSGVTVNHGDLMTVPYANHAGGTPTPISGAATSTYNEYYPTFSPDDRLVAYNRIADGANSYNNAQAEVWIIPSAGGTPQRLAANTPPSCSGKSSPGVTNSWPKWAPAVTTVGGKRYYWVTFSSTRSAAGNPQLYVTPVVDDGVTRTTYPALYLWNQPSNENNHTPAWDNFDIPVN
ncbi:MAG TPA: hypothetical protein VL463_11800 [Kofleriaceae bacterium]|nr:hypothetical protein [Kofleriaceae bacterium]